MEMEEIIEKIETARRLLIQAISECEEPDRRLHLWEARFALTEAAAYLRGIRDERSAGRSPLWPRPADRAARSFSMARMLTPSPSKLPPKQNRMKTAAPRITTMNPPAPAARPATGTGRSRARIPVAALVESLLGALHHWAHRHCPRCSSTGRAARPRASWSRTRMLLQGPVAALCYLWRSRGRSRRSAPGAPPRGESTRRGSSGGELWRLLISPGADRCLPIGIRPGGSPCLDTCRSLAQVEAHLFQAEVHLRSARNALKKMPRDPDLFEDAAFWRLDANSHFLQALNSLRSLRGFITRTIRL